MSLSQSFSLIHTMASMRLKADAKKMVLSYIWWALEPLLYAVMFFIVFTYIRSTNAENFFLFLMIGKIPYMWFSKGVISASNSINASKGLISLRPISKWIFPMVSIQETMYKQLTAMFVMLALVIANGFYHFGYWWQLLPVVLIQYILICGVGMICSIFKTYAEDFGMLISMAMMGLMFSSGIFWDLNLIADPLVKKILLTYNPLAAIIDAYRQILMHGQVLNWTQLIPAIVMSIVVLVIGVSCLNLLSNRLTRRLFV